jgi:signal transduction histidine kinase
MTTAQSELVFQAFTQVERHIGELEGFGLGLAICKRLSEWMGGAISYKPQPDGTGSRFIVELPQTILSANVRNVL